MKITLQSVARIFAVFAFALCWSSCEVREEQKDKQAILSDLAALNEVVAGEVAGRVIPEESTRPDLEVEETSSENQELPEGAAHKSGLNENAVTVESTWVPTKRTAQKQIPSVDGKPAPISHKAELAYSSGTYTPDDGVDARILEKAKSEKALRYTYAFIYLESFLNPDIEANLNRYGAKIIDIHSDAYKIRLPLDTEKLQQIVALDEVRWLSYPLNEQKLDNDLQEVLGKVTAEDITTLPILINYFEQSAFELALPSLQKQGIRVGAYDTDLDATTALVPTQKVDWLAAQEYVLFMELESVMKLTHDQSIPAMGVDYIRSGNLRATYSGANIRMGIMDSGFMMGGTSSAKHVDLDKWGCGKNFVSDGISTWNDEDGHGTHVLATIAGLGRGNPQYRGVAPGLGHSRSTQIRAARVFDGEGSGNTLWSRQAMDYMDDASSCSSGRPHIVNFSGGKRATNSVGTDASSRKLDNKVWAFNQTYVMAAGNEGSGLGTINQPASAKNALTVGNVWDDIYQTVGDAARSSSRGPTGDNRMKPNLVATGTWINSAKAGTSNGYTNKKGTSMAAPHIAGMAATLMEHYSSLKSRPDLMRAHMMATAILHDDKVYPNKNDNGGRSHYGLGRASTYASHYDRPNSIGWSSHWAIRTITNTQWGYTDVYVPSGTDRLVVVMTWDETAASAGASKAVKYDLDLWVDRGADCNSDSKGQCGEYASRSDIDNTEYVIINNPSAGTYRLKMTNWSAPSSGIPAAIVAMVIKGDPTPSLNFLASANTTSPAVGSIVEVTTRVTSPSYILSGTFVERTNYPPGLSYIGVEQVLKDGTRVVLNYDRSMTLGNIVQGDGRSAIWRFKVTDQQTKHINFQTWAENGGAKWKVVTLRPRGGALPDTGDENDAFGSTDNMLAVFPNPADEKMTVEYHLQEEEAVRVQVLNSLGQLVTEFTPGLQSAGQHMLPIYPSDYNMTPGQYYIRLQTDSSAKLMSVTMLGTP
ncbi:MAG: S8 family serine peptidase [Bacteroidota bacterium]